MRSPPATQIGAAAALINTNLTGQPLAHAITAGNSRKVVAGDEHAASVEEVIADLKTLDDERPVLLHVQDTAQQRQGGEQPLNEAAQSAPASKPQVTFDANSEALFCYIYTSGTTGLPKAAVISHRRAMIGGLGAAHVMMRLKPGDVSYIALPLYHSSAMFIGWSAVLNSGAAMALRRKFSVTHFWDDVRRFGATHSVYIGELCRYLLNGEPGPGDRDHNLRCMMGNGLRPDIWHEFQERFGIPEIREFYGATEGTAGLLNRSGKPATRRPASRFAVPTGSAHRLSRGRSACCWDRSRRRPRSTATSTRRRHRRRS
jgi:acyl-CoA synthetase (AMP-forming)/AMP-acid ligase II